MIDFFVPGIPRPAGSKTAMPIRRNGALVIMEQRIEVGRVYGRPAITVVDSSSEAGKVWRSAVAAYGKKAHMRPPLQGPLCLLVEFHLPRPKAHYGTGRNAAILKHDAPAEHLQKPDSTKLLRAVEDALTGILWLDDCQIVRQVVEKRWADLNHEGALIVVRPIG